MPDNNTNVYQSDQGIKDRREHFFNVKLEEHTDFLRQIARNTEVSVEGINTLTGTKSGDSSKESIKSSNEVVKSLKDLINVVGEQNKYMSKQDIIESDRYKVEYQKRVTEMLAQQSDQFKDQATALQQFLAEQNLTNKPIEYLVESGVFDTRGTGKISAGGAVYTEEESKKIATAVSAIMGKIDSPDKKDKLDMGDFLKKEKIRYKTDSSETKKYRSEYLQYTKGLSVIMSKGFKSVTDELEKSNYNLLGAFSNKFGGWVAAGLAVWFTGNAIGKAIARWFMSGEDAEDARQAEITRKAQKRTKAMFAEKNAANTAKMKKLDDDLKKAQEAGDVEDAKFIQAERELQMAEGRKLQAKRRVVNAALGSGLFNDYSDTRLMNMSIEDILKVFDARGGNSTGKAIGRAMGANRPTAWGRAKGLAHFGAKSTLLGASLVTQAATFGQTGDWSGVGESVASDAWKRKHELDSAVSNFNRSLSKYNQTVVNSADIMEEAVDEMEKRNKEQERLEKEKKVLADKQKALEAERLKKERESTIKLANLDYESYKKYKKLKEGGVSPTELDMVYNTSKMKKFREIESRENMVENFNDSFIAKFNLIPESIRKAAEDAFVRLGNAGGTNNITTTNITQNGGGKETTPMSVTSARKNVAGAKN